jgi:hypothetical protein
MNNPYVDSFWATKKRQVPFQVGNVMIVWESSYGMTIKNPGQLPSDILREAVDDAIDRAFTIDIERFTNSGSVKKMIEMAKRYDGEPVVVTTTIEEIENTIPPVVEEQPVSASIESTRPVSRPEGEVANMSLQELINKGLLTVGAGQ